MRLLNRRGIWVPEEPLPRNAILGCVDLVDCVEESDSPWSRPDNYYWVLRRPRRLVRPARHAGGLGLIYRRPPQGELVRARRARRSYRS